MPSQFESRPRFPGVIARSSPWFDKPTTSPGGPPNPWFKLSSRGGRFLTDVAIQTNQQTAVNLNVRIAASPFTKVSGDRSAPYQGLPATTSQSFKPNSRIKLHVLKMQVQACAN